MKKTILVSVLIACASAVICSLILVKPSILFRNEGSIRVKGSVSKVVESDIAIWNASVVERDASASKAYDKIQKAKSLVCDFLKSKGVNIGDVDFSLSFSQIFKRSDKGYVTDEIAAYSYALNMSFSSSNVALIESLSREASALVQRGISINSDNPQYLYSKLEDLKLELLSRASENAKERAKLLVSGSGAKLGKVVSASQGVFQITAPLSTATSDYGIYDTSCPKKQVTCVVTIQFAVE